MEFKLIDAVIAFGTVFSLSIGALFVIHATLNHLESRETGKEPFSMKAVIRYNYRKKNINSKLLDYFDTNYSQFMYEASRKMEKERNVAEQKKKEELTQEKELQRELEALEQRQKSRLKSFNTVKDIA